MPLFLIERNFAEALDASLDVEGINAVNEEEGVEWIYSFLSADMRKTYCLYEATSAEAIRAAAIRAGLPADSIVEVRRGFNCLYTGLADGEVPGAPYDLISLFNVIDRCPRPRSLLDTLHDALTPDGQLLLATPLPYQPFYYRGASGRRPLEALPQNAPTWEEGVVRLAEEFLELSGFEVVSVSRCPYLSGGDRHSGLYVLDDAVFLCSKRA
jgi:SAM-dependent methyltransferase